MVEIVLILTLSLWASDAESREVHFHKNVRSSAQTINTCLAPWFAERVGSDSCWVRQQENGYTLCIGKDVWRHGILGKNRFAQCGTWSGKWRITSPLANPPLGDEKKVIHRRFTANGFIPKGKLSWLRKIKSEIELSRERAAEWMTPYDPLGVCRHLLLNQKTPGNPSSLLRELGFVHLLTATGIHLYALAAWSSRVILFLATLIGGSRAATLPIMLLVSRALTGAAWLWAWCMSGGRPGMLRPWIVILVRTVARQAGFRWRRWAPLSVALSTDLAVALGRAWLDLPGAWAPGRWIYALAVGGGMLTLESSRGKNAFLQHWHLAVGSWVLVASYEASVHQLVALATPVLSLLTIPLFCTSFFPVLLMSSVFDLFGWTIAAQKLAATASWFSTQIIILLFQCVAWARTLWVLPSWALAGGAVLAAFLTFQRFSGRARIWAIMLALVFGTVSRACQTSQNVTGSSEQITAHSIEQLDVGQGDAALVWSGNQIGMVDTRPENALSDSAWIRLFAGRQLVSLDWVMLTHSDEDHAGGLRKLKTLLPLSCRGGASGCIPFAVSRDESGSSRGKRNQNMSAILIPLEGGGFYLSAGDSHADHELAIARWVKRQFIFETEGKRILKISHHGSRTSTTREFLSLVQPTDAWISSGAGNSYGHPTAQVLDLLSSWKIKTSRTDLEGNARWSARGGVDHRR